MSKDRYVAAAMIAALTMPGCRDVALPPPPALVRATTIPTAPRPLERQPGSYPSEFAAYYRDLIERQVYLREHARVPGTITTNVYNATEYRLDPNVANAIYSVIDGIREPVNFGTFLFNGQERTVRLSKRPGIRERTTVIISEDMPHPDWQQYNMNMDEHLAGTVIDGQIAFSYVEASLVKDTIFDTPQEQAMLGFVIEACQQTLMARIFDKQGRAIIGRQENNDAQELGCNTLGLGLAAAATGVPYQNYLKEVRVRRELPYRPMSEIQYKSGQPIGSIIK